MQDRITYLDGLRGLAALVVLISHYLCTFYPAFIWERVTDVHTSDAFELLAAHSAWKILYNGSFAVSVFFAISGYVLSYTFFAKGNKEMIVSSAFRRCFRLGIPVLASALLSYLLMKLNWYAPAFKTSSVSYSAWLAENWNFDPDFFLSINDPLYWLRNNITTRYNNVLWTITTEIKGSYLVYVILLLAGKSKWRWLLYAAVGCFTFNTYYTLFISGMILCDLQQTRLKQLPVAASILLLCVAVYLGSGIHLSYVNNWLNTEFIAAFLLLFVCTTTPLIQQLLSLKAIRFSGEISFALYLFHLLWIGTFVCLLFNTFYFDAGFSYHVSALSAIILSFPVIIALSFLVYLYIDKPANRFSKWVYARCIRPYLPAKVLKAMQGE